MRHNHHCKPEPPPTLGNRLAGIALAVLIAGSVWGGLLYFLLSVKVQP